MLVPKLLIVERIPRGIIIDSGASFQTLRGAFQLAMPLLTDFNDVAIYGELGGDAL